MDQIKNVFIQLISSQPFDFYFLDDAYDQLYRREKRLAVMIGYLEGLAILLGCMGLFGLAAYSTQRRSKEIGIRKVLGASAPGIFMLLSRGLSKWVLLANIIAWPVAYYFMNRWLQNFAYRVGLNVWVFLLSGLAIRLAMPTHIRKSFERMATIPDMDDPNILRIPISLVRCWAIKEARPKRPKQAINTANPVPACTSLPNRTSAL